MVKDANNHSACTCMVKVVTLRGAHSRLPVHVSAIHVHAHVTTVHVDRVHTCTCITHCKVIV